MIDKICQDIKDNIVIVVTDSTNNSFVFAPAPNMCSGTSEVLVIASDNFLTCEKKYKLDSELDLQILVRYGEVFLLTKSTTELLATDPYYSSGAPFITIDKEKLINTLQNIVYTI